PVHREIDATNLDVIGDVPRDLAGVYVRNGPNPRFPPLGSYTFPMEGDGMLHALWLDDGEARYKNRFVRTRSMEAEEQAGKAIFGGLMTPAFVDPALLGPDPDPGWPIKLDAFINIVHHAGHWLALEEGTPAYEVTPELETIGRFDFAGGLPKGITAHPKLDPRTGELVVFRYDVEAPFLTWAVVAPDGTVARAETEVDGVDRGYMIHDFAITEHHLVLMLGPAVFDIDAMMSGGQVLAWKPELGTRFAVIPRDGGAPAWIDTDAFWVWHFANAYEDGDAIVLDFPRWNVPGFLAPGTPVVGEYARATLRPSAGTVVVDALHARGTEFPRIDDRLVGSRHRYVTVGAGSGRRAVKNAEHDVLCRIDLATGDWVEQTHDIVFGEVVFAPRTGGADPLDGYYVAFGTGLDDDRSGLVIWDAATFPAPPRARILTPQRIPNGLHGNWFPAS
ncbi:MAG TPA: carotenoid oxygenase family protein, partial [Acidimicrobiia bacterium]|nr:carotenoid oxygenase family protein [Acidimicrobiia bacterium]